MARTSAKAKAKPQTIANSTKTAAAKSRPARPTVMLDDSLKSNRQKVVRQRPKANPAERKENGQLLPGVVLNPVGRPPGSKNKLVEDFLRDFCDVWQIHGRTALEAMASDEPSSFVRAAVQLMPKDVLVDARGAGLVVVRLDDVDMKL